MAARYPTNIVAFAQDELHKTNSLGKTTLSAAITGAPATFSLTSATTVTTWPTATFVVEVENTDGTNSELIYVSSRSGTTCTVGARGQDGTSTLDHASGSTVRVVLASKTIQQTFDELIAMQGHSGVAASLVTSKAFADSPYTATSSDSIIAVTTAGGAVTINLPTAVGIKGRVYSIIKTNSDLNAVTIDANGAQTINGQLTYLITGLFESVYLISDNANWIALSHYSVKNNFNATAAPTTGDDYGDGFALGSLWVDKTNDKAYILLDGTVAAAVWTEITQAGGGGAGLATYTEQTTDATMSVNTGYVAGGAGLRTLTLPASAAIGDRLAIVGKSSGGWKIAQGAGQKIIWTDGAVAGIDETTTGATGKIESTDDNDSVVLVCLAANTTFSIESLKGTPTLT